jgi:hypothetical protein
MHLFIFVCVFNCFLYRLSGVENDFFSLAPNKSHPPPPPPHLVQQRVIVTSSLRLPPIPITGIAPPFIFVGPPPPPPAAAAADADRFVKEPLAGASDDAVLWRRKYI